MPGLKEMEPQFAPAIPPGSRSPILPAGHTGSAGFSRSFTYHRLFPSSSAASAQDRADLPWEVSGRERSSLALLCKLLCHPDAGTQDLEVPKVSRGVIPVCSETPAPSLPPSLPAPRAQGGWGWMVHTWQQNAFPALSYWQGNVNHWLHLFADSKL